MTELAAKILDKYGFMALVLAALLYMMNENRKDASEERQQHAAIMIDQIADLREKMERCVK